MLKLLAFLILSPILFLVGIVVLVPGLLAAVGGIAIGVLAPVGALALVGVIAALVCSGVGALVTGILCVAMLIVTIVALPVLLPLAIVFGIVFLVWKLLLA